MVPVTRRDSGYMTAESAANDYDYGSIVEPPQKAVAEQQIEPVTTTSTTVSTTDHLTNVDSQGADRSVPATDLSGYPPDEFDYTYGDDRRYVDEEELEREYNKEKHWEESQNEIAKVDDTWEQEVCFAQYHCK